MVKHNAAGFTLVCVGLRFRGRHQVRPGDSKCQDHHISWYLAGQQVSSPARWCDGVARNGRKRWQPGSVLGATQSQVRL